MNCGSCKHNKNKCIYEGFCPDKEKINKIYNQGLSDGKNLAIDEFSEKLKARLLDAIYPKDLDSMKNLINDISNELKGK